MGIESKLAEAQIEMFSELANNLQSQLHENWTAKQPATQAQIDELKLEIEKLRLELTKVQSEAKSNLLKWCVLMLFVQVILAVFYIVNE